MSVYLFIYIIKNLKKWFKFSLKFNYSNGALPINQNDKWNNLILPIKKTTPITMVDSNQHVHVNMVVLFFVCHFGYFLLQNPLEKHVL
jgi:hypothetical protein